MIAHASEVPQKRYREPLIAHAESARQSRELARIRTDVPVEFDAEALRYRGAFRARCFEIFNALAFRTLAAEYAPSASATEKLYRVITALEDVSALAAQLKASGRFALSIMPDQPSAMTASIVGLACSTGPREATYIPTGHRSLGALGSLPLDGVLAAMRPVLESDAITKVGHDLKFETILLARHGITLRGLALDTMIASYLLESTRSAHTLEDLALEHASYKVLTEEDVCGRGAKAVTLADLPIESVLHYAGERTDLADQLAPILRGLLEQEQLIDLYLTLEQPLIPVLAAIEQAGVLLDGPALSAQSQRIDLELTRRTKDIYAVAGGDFNIGSPKQLAEVLFDRLQLPVLKKTGTLKAASTAVEVLEELALSHDLPRMILEWRALMKLKSTYVDALPQLVNPTTGRVHTCFHQAVTATGRLSSRDPNLQNIPIRTELGREIRRAFIAEPGYVLISADYSQIEFRVLAHLADEDVLIEAFRRGADFHEQTALKLFGADSGRDPHELRATAKMVNYAVLYGKTPFTLAKDINVAPQAAQEFIQAYFAGFPRVRAFLDGTLEEARRTGVVKTMFGRRRLVPELNSRDFQRRSAAEREAVNLPIQGTAADIMKRAMLQIQRALGSDRDARMILTVHDELLFEVTKARAEEIGALIRERMESATELKVPLTVDLGIGKNWRDAKH